MTQLQAGYPDGAYADGNVGIRTVTPDTALHAFGSENDGTTASLKISTATGHNMLLDGNEIDCTSGPLYPNNNSPEDVFMVNAGGNVGIANTSPSARLDVTAASGEPSIVTRGGRDYATAAGQFMDFGHWDGTTFTTDMSIGPSGSVGIRKAYHNVNLNVRNRPGDNVVFLCENSDGTSVFEVQSDGDIFGCGIVCLSDARWKKNIRTLGGALEKVLQLRGVTYE